MKKNITTIQIYTALVQTNFILSILYKDGVKKMVWYNDKNVWECNGLIIEYSPIKRDIDWIVNYAHQNIVNAQMKSMHN